MDRRLHSRSRIVLIRDFAGLERYNLKISVFKRRLRTFCSVIVVEQAARSTTDHLKSVHQARLKVLLMNRQYGVSIYNMALSCEFMSLGLYIIPLQQRNEPLIPSANDYHDEISHSRYVQQYFY